MFQKLIDIEMVGKVPHMFSLLFHVANMLSKMLRVYTEVETIELQPLIFFMKLLRKLCNFILTNNFIILFNHALLLYLG